MFKKLPKNPLNHPAGVSASTRGLPVRILELLEDELPEIYSLQLPEWGIQLPGWIR